MTTGLAALLLGMAAATHPLHSSSASLTVEDNGRLTLSVRIFTDDLAAAAPGGDSSIVAYVRRRVMLTTRDGPPIVLDVVTIARDGELTQVTVRGMVRGGVTGLRVQHAVLWERYRDQVNLVRALVAGRTATLVFANGDPPREVA